MVVKADNTRHVDDIPTVNTDWWNYGGITRDVYLVETPALFIRDYFIQLAKNSKTENNVHDGNGNNESQQKISPEKTILLDK